MKKITFLLLILFLTSSCSFENKNDKIKNHLTINEKEYSMKSTSLKYKCEGIGCQYVFTIHSDSIFHENRSNLEGGLVTKGKSMTLICHVRSGDLFDGSYELNQEKNQFARYKWYGIYSDYVKQLGSASYSTNNFKELVTGTVSIRANGKLFEILFNGFNESAEIVRLSYSGSISVDQPLPDLIQLKMNN
jgi:hypothetical protein